MHKAVGHTTLEKTAGRPTLDHTRKQEYMHTCQYEAMTVQN